MDMAPLETICNGIMVNGSKIFLREYQLLRGMHSSRSNCSGPVGKFDSGGVAFHARQHKALPLGDREMLDLPHHLSTIEVLTTGLQPPPLHLCLIL
jgi:hypothetical protein